MDTADDERRHGEFGRIEMREDGLARAEFLDHAATDDDLVVFGDRIGGRAAPARRDHALGSPLTGIATAPAHERQAVRKAPAFQIAEAATGHFVGEKTKRLAGDMVVWLERFAIPFDGAALARDEVGQLVELGGAERAPDYD